MNRIRISIIIFCCATVAQPAEAGTVSASMNAKVYLPAQCVLQVSTLTDSFGTTTASAGGISLNEKLLSTIGVLCSPSAIASIYLQSQNVSSSQFRMKNGSNYIDYTVYMDAARTQPWPQSSGSSFGAITGSGTHAMFNLYGRVPAQSVSLAGTYTDTMTFTVSF